MMKDKIGLLGGTFNPIHKGHVELGLKVFTSFKLNKILFILSGIKSRIRFILDRSCLDVLRNNTVYSLLV